MSPELARNLKTAITRLKAERDAYRRLAEARGHWLRSLLCAKDVDEVYERLAELDEQGLGEARW